MNKLLLNEEYKSFEISDFMAHTVARVFRTVDVLDDKTVVQFKNDNGNYGRKKYFLRSDDRMIIIPLKDCLLKADSETNSFTGNAKFNFLNSLEELKEQLKLNVNEDFELSKEKFMVQNEEGLMVEVNTEDLLEETIDLMDSTPENDLISPLVEELLADDDKVVFTEYHVLGDGKHRVFIDEERAFEINAWNNKKDIEEAVKEWKAAK